MVSHQPSKLASKDTEGSSPFTRSNNWKRNVWRLLLAFVLSVGFISTTNAALVAAPAYGECRDHLNNPIKYVGVNVITFKILRPNATLASTTNRPKIIIYDAESLSYLPPQFQQMVYQHECGHFELGHLVPSAFSQHPSIASRRERQADCYAGIAMRYKLGFSDQDIKVATDTMVSLNLGNSLRHGSSESRAETILQCSK